MALRALPILLFLTAALLVPPAQAGTAEAPEMPDAAGDACLDVSPGGPAPPVPCAPAGQAAALDVQAAWVQADDPQNLTFFLRVGATPPVASAGAGATLPVGGCAAAGGGFAYAVHFRTRDPAGQLLAEADADGNVLTDLYVAAAGRCDTAATVGGSGWDFLLAYTYDGDATSILATQAVPGAAEEGGFRWDVPRSHPLVALPAGDAAAGHAVTDLSAEATVALQLVAGSGALSADSAPDSGFGANFTFPAPDAAAEEPANATAEDAEDAEAPAATTTVTATQTLTVTETETWTSTPLPLVVEQDAPGPGTAGVAVLLLAVAGFLVRRRSS